MTDMKHPAAPVLLVDDEPQFLQSASFSLRSAGFGNIETCGDSRRVMEMMAANPPSVAILDYLMPHKNGRELLDDIARAYPDVPVIMLTAVDEVDTAVAFMKHGAFDYIVKPVDKARLVTCVTRALEYRDVRSENARLKERLLAPGLTRPEAFEGIVTRAASMHAIFQYVEAIAGTSLPVLVTGDTGTGKESAARAVHAASGRTGGFVPVNVAGLDDNLFSDTLFGHEKGAFTGADAKRLGLIGKAAGGTLFLDEIGDLAMESQVKLLRLLEDRTYYPLGSDAPLRTDARVVVATNVDLAAAQREGKFRSDLYYRLQSHHVRLPALKERPEDIALLTDFFLEQAAAEMDKPAPTPPPELYTLLGTYPFPGNIRELKSMVYDAVSRHRSGIISMDAFRARIAEAGPVPAGGSPARPSDVSDRVFFTEQLPTIKEAETALVEEALKRAKNNQTIAAQMLGLTRSALNKRLNRAKD